jgi:hypothetical protein
MDQIKFEGIEKILNSYFPQYISPLFSSTPIEALQKQLSNPTIL